MTSVCVANFLIGQARRPWPEVLRVASANYFALLALAILLTGICLLFRVKRWGKVAGTLTLIAGSVLLGQVLRDIRAEIPRHAETGQPLSVVEH